MTTTLSRSFRIHSSSPPLPFPSSSSPSSFSSPSYPSPLWRACYFCNGGRSSHSPSPPSLLPFFFLFAYHSLLSNPFFFFFVSFITFERRLNPLLVSFPSQEFSHARPVFCCFSSIFDEKTKAELSRLDDRYD